MKGTCCKGVVGTFYDKKKKNKPENISKTKQTVTFKKSKTTASFVVILLMGAE